MRDGEKRMICQKCRSVEIPKGKEKYKGGKVICDKCFNHKPRKKSWLDKFIRR